MEQQNMTLEELKSVKMIAADMDHTLLLEDGSLPPGFERYIHKLNALGIDFVISSGRPIYTLQQMFPELWDQMSFICDNGGIIIHKGETVYKSIIEKQACKELIRFAESRHEGIPLLCALDSAYLLKKHEEYADFLRKFYFNVTCVEGDSLDVVESEADKFTVYHPNGNAHQTHADWYGPVYGDQFEVAICDTRWIDIMNTGVDKGTAMRSLGRILGVGTDQMMAFGDSYNDVKMLQTVRYSFLVRNAVADMQQYARYMTASNEEYGVLQMLDQVIASHEAN